MLASSGLVLFGRNQAAVLVALSYFYVIGDNEEKLFVRPW